MITVTFRDISRIHQPLTGVMEMNIDEIQAIRLDNKNVSHKERVALLDATENLLDAMDARERARIIVELLGLRIETDKGWQAYSNLIDTFSTAIDNNQTLEDLHDMLRDGVTTALTENLEFF